MTEQVKKKALRSPNYPIQPLEWAVTTALELLTKDGLHAVPADIVARNLGYKDAKNGKVGRVLANLKAFGVIEKAPGGKLAVSKDVQRYKLVPTEDEKNTYLKQWLKKPLLYKKVLEKYQADLPSDAVLLFELVDEHGFNESAAQKAIKVFRASLDFIDHKTGGIEEDFEEDEDLGSDDEQVPPPPPPPRHGQVTPPPPPRHGQVPPPPSPPPASDSFRYPIRLAGGRMAWIEVPSAFYEADKVKLRAQIEVIGTDDEDNDFGDFEM